MRDLARLAMTAFGRRGERSGVIGVDVQRIRRASACRRAGGGAEGERGRRSTRESVRQFERHLRRELERATIERTGKLPPPARSPSSTARCRPAPPRTWPRSTAPSPS